MGSIPDSVTFFRLIVYEAITMLRNNIPDLTKVTKVEHAEVTKVTKVEHAQVTKVTKAGNAEVTKVTKVQGAILRKLRKIPLFQTLTWRKSDVTKKNVESNRLDAPLVAVFDELILSLYISKTVVFDQFLLGIAYAISEDVIFFAPNIESQL